ncbi:5-amino-6-(5-phospho-D-ribitylamino)uracil phosphatase YigB [Photobacterium japonica]|uniref:5-amino-6-(5-phospho-D-ribitylamino)uracil phosphatase YigB n=1 Tax=Photobacterium japonica TaxID=2910235 RepID=UPI003D105D14
MQVYRPFPAPKAITFDLDDTLYDNRPVIRRAEQAMYDWLAREHPVTNGMGPARWQALKQAVAQVDPFLHHDVTQWRFEYLKIGLMQFGYPLVLAEQAAQQGVDHVLAVRNQVDVPAETHRVLTALSQRVPLVAITNGNVDVEKIGLAPYFSAVFMAGRDGMAKPESDLFVQAAHHLGVAPSAILHVGDHPVSDVGGALQNGFRACWFNDQDRQWGDDARAQWQPDVEITALAQLLSLLDGDNGK